MVLDTEVSYLRIWWNRDVSDFCIKTILRELDVVKVPVFVTSGESGKSQQEQHLDMNDILVFRSYR